MSVHVRVISQHPPGGRCSLYAAYAEVLAAHLDTCTEVVTTTGRDAHGSGFPSLWLNGSPVQLADGVIPMSGDVCAALVVAVQNEATLAGLAKALEAPLHRMMDGA
mgnify:FL=1